MSRVKQKAKEGRIHRNSLRNKSSRVRQYMAGEKIADRPNWK